MTLNIRAACLNERKADFDKEKKMVTFYFVTYGKKNEYGEIFLKGSLTNAMLNKNISEIKHFKNHCLKNPPGVVRSISEDDYGAFATCELLKTEAGEETYEEYLAEQITQHSFGFMYRDGGFNYNKETDAIIITNYELKEVSSLNSWGADPNTKTINLNGQEFDRTEFINSIKNGESKQINIDNILNSIKL